MTHVIIDGYNLIRQVSELTRLENVSLAAARDRLILLLQHYAEAKKHSVTVVFDGRGGLGEAAVPYRDGAVDVIFSRLGEDADSVIKRLLSELGARAVLVSSDRDIINWAKSTGSGQISSPRFFQRLMAAISGDMSGFIKTNDVKSTKTHKRWQTYKKGPSKKLPKSQRRNRLKTEKI